MSYDIEKFSPASGRYVGEDGSVWNMADFYRRAPLAFMFVQASEPTAQAGDFWLDLSGPTLKIRNNSGWSTVTLT